MKPLFCLASSLLLFWAAAGAQNGPEALELMGKVPLPGVHGRIDHLAADFYHGRLFVAALTDNSVQVVDVRNSTLLKPITGLASPQGVAYVKSTNLFFVTNGPDGTLRSFDGVSLKPRASLSIGSDADNIRVDTARKRMYVGYGEGALSVLDLTGKRLFDIPLKAHPESFQFAEQRPRIFVNLPDIRSIAVLDSASNNIVGQWPITEGSDNFPMALDEANQRVFVTCRSPARLLVLDMQSGLVLASLPTTGDTDDLFYDPIHARLYAVGGAGRVSIYAQETADRYSRIGETPTAAGARTGLFVPEWNRFFVAVRELGNRPAEIRIYQPH